MWVEHEHCTYCLNGTVTTTTTRACPQCQGYGFVPEHSQLYGDPNNYMAPTGQKRCFTCDGAAWIEKTEDSTCKVCYGKGYREIMVGGRDEREPPAIPPRGKGAGQHTEPSVPTGGQGNGTGTGKSHRIVALILTGFVGWGIYSLDQGGLFLPWGLGADPHQQAQEHALAAHRAKLQSIEESFNQLKADPADRKAFSRLAGYWIDADPKIRSKQPLFGRHFKPDEQTRLSPEYLDLHSRLAYEPVGKNIRLHHITLLNSGKTINQHALENNVVEGGDPHREKVTFMSKDRIRITELGLDDTEYESRIFYRVTEKEFTRRFPPKTPQDIQRIQQEVVKRIGQGMQRLAKEFQNKD